MAVTRSRKNKRNPHYGFLVSWEPKQTKSASVKGESKIEYSDRLASIRHGKRADSLAQAEPNAYIKKDLVRSLIVISLVLILELVVYLARNKFIVK